MKHKKVEISRSLSRFGSDWPFLFFASGVGRERKSAAVGLDGAIYGEEK